MKRLWFGRIELQKGVTMKRALERVGRVPFVTLAATLVLVAAYAIEVALAFAWFLRCLEIHSIFDRWLPGSAWYLILLLVIVLAAQGLWSMLLTALEGDHGALGNVRGAGAGVRILGANAGDTAVGVVKAGMRRPTTKWGVTPREQP